MTWAIESGRIAVPPAVAGRPDPLVPPAAASGPREVAVTVDVPSGRLACAARLDADGRVTVVRFRNVPSFVLARDLSVATTRGPLTVDIGYGGAFYGSVDVRTIGRHVEPGALTDLIALQRELRPALEAAVDVVHPLEPELRGVYGVIFWEPIEATPAPADDPAPARHRQRNVTVFADGEVDRSPCGSGTSARLAILHARGEIGVGERLHHRSIVDSAFDGWVTGETHVAGRAAVVTEVEGSAFRTGEHRFVLDDRDEIGTGFLLR